MINGHREVMAELESAAEHVAELRGQVAVLEAEVARLKTWAGLLSILDTHYPADVFDGSSGDEGPRIVALVREIGRLRTSLEAP
jgi:uncharacterized small protein (DUF1192 family)